jgi:hypothetical protein
LFPNNRVSQVAKVIERWRVRQARGAHQEVLVHVVAVRAVGSTVAHPILHAGQQHRGADLSTQPSSHMQRREVHWPMETEVLNYRGDEDTQAHMRRCTHAVAACTGWCSGSDGLLLLCWGRSLEVEHAASIRAVRPGVITWHRIASPSGLQA